jgi:hypothetical protein
MHDRARAEAARSELDQIVEIVSGAVGLRCRSRALGSGAERARSAVTWRIRSAIRKIAHTHPRLGRHLENSLRTGTYCVYEPETPNRMGVLKNAPLARRAGGAVSAMFRTRSQHSIRSIA